MRWAVVLVAFCAGALLAESLAIQPRFRAGQRLTFEITSSHTDRSQPQRNSSGLISGTMTVLETGADGTVLDWVPQAATHGDPNLQAIAAAVQGVHFQVRLSPLGTYAGLKNRSEVDTRMRAASEHIMKELLARVPEAQRPQFQAIVGPFLTAEALINNAVKELSLWTGLHGTTVQTGQKTLTLAEADNPFVPGGRLRSEVNRTVGQRDEAKGEAVVTIEQNYDTAELRGVVQQLLAQALAGRTFSPERMPVMQLVDSTEYTLALNRGWAKRVKMTRNMAVGNLIQRTDRTEIAVELAADQP